MNKEQKKFNKVMKLRKNRRGYLKQRNLQRNNAKK